MQCEKFEKHRHVEEKNSLTISKNKKIPRINLNTKNNTRNDKILLKNKTQKMGKYSVLMD